MKDSLWVDRIPNHKWDELTVAFRDTSYRQCSSYAAAAAKLVGAKSELAGLMDNQRLIGLADVRIKNVPMTPWGIAYANYAPIVMQDERFSEQEFGRCLDALRQEYVERRRLVLRVTPALNGGLFQDLQAACLAARGFRPCSRQAQRETIVLDLLRPLDEIRRSLDPKWRSDLVKSEKAGIKITSSIELNDFDNFEKIFLDLTERKGFMPNQDVRFFKYVQSAAPPDHKFVFHLAWHDNELIGGHLGSYVGDTAVYLLGAASSTGRKLRASFLLQWSAIAHAQRVGNSFYDLGGIDKQKNPDVYRFKRRLNGRLVTEIGPYELAPDEVSRRVIQLAERVRSTVRRKVYHG
jgi:lipid II:glycine glycyltransferase (peptidoglycan interpeptide bridge formation enzyme)